MAIQIQNRDINSTKRLESIKATTFTSQPKTPQPEKDSVSLSSKNQNSKDSKSFMQKHWLKVVGSLAAIGLAALLILRGKASQTADNLAGGSQKYTADMIGTNYADNLAGGSQKYTADMIGTNYADNFMGGIEQPFSVQNPMYRVGDMDPLTGQILCY